MTDTNIPLKVLIIDDQILFRDGLKSLLSSTPDFEVVGGAGSVHEGIKLALQTSPDLILMDFSLPDGTGLDATSAILRVLPACKIVFLTVFETPENLFTALRMGAAGYMLKDITSSDLLSSLRALNRGEKAVSRKMMSVVMDEFSRIYTNGETSTDAEKLLTRLSKRELDVLRELANDTSNLEIAQKLYLSENTVKHHIRNILDKLEAKNRREVVAFARQNIIKNNQTA